MDYLYQKTLATKQVVQRADRYADVVVSAPPQALFETRPFVLFQAIGIPASKPEGIPAEPMREHVPDRVRILHCPSVPEAKGTPVIRAAIEALRRKGHAIEYVEITGKPNAVVLEELARCDFVVDHVYSDSPAGTFVSEAAFFAKPAVLAGYCQAFVDTITSIHAPPSVYCLPEQIETEIERLVVDQSLREKIGKQAQEFVERHWTPIEFAKRFLVLIQDQTPAEWICNPYDIDFVPVAGMPESKARDVISRLIARHGLEALQLQDKPKLESLFAEFAKTGSRGRVKAAH